MRPFPLVSGRDSDRETSKTENKVIEENYSGHSQPWPTPTTLPSLSSSGFYYQQQQQTKQNPSTGNLGQVSQVYEQPYDTNFPSIGTELPTDNLASTASRRGWLQRQQQLQTQQQQQLNPNRSQQNQQEQESSSNLVADPQYPHPSLLPRNAATVSENRAPSGFAAPSFFSGAEGSNTSHDGTSMLGMNDSSFTTASSTQTDFEGQQASYSDQASHGQGSIGTSSLQRAQDYRADGSDPSSLASSSEWNALPNLRLQLRGMQGDLMSNSNASSFGAPPERGKRHQSRAHLQKQLRSLQTEMAALKERVREAETLYREASPGATTSDPSHDNRMFDLYGRRSTDQFEVRDFRNENRVSSSGGTGDTSTESQNNSAYSSSLLGYSGTAWRQHPYGSTSQTTSSAPSISAVPGRRGTWRTGAGGNVLVFNTAGTSEVDSSRSGASRERALESVAMDEGDDEEEGAEGVGDDSGKRYQCLVPGCQKSFTTSGHARRHSRTHLGHKLFVCPHEGCGSTFTRRDNCRQHQRARHRTTLPVPELTEAESLENLILDRQQDLQSSYRLQREPNEPPS